MNSNQRKFYFVAFTIFTRLWALAALFYGYKQEYAHAAYSIGFAVLTQLWADKQAED